MDFMKILDQTVREIKREVNLKVLKVPEIEQKVLDATNDEAWGPHGTALSEIAQATRKITECQLIMNVLWIRLTDTGPNWRHVYKALTVIEYLMANGSERAVDDILEHTFQISAISGFEYVDPSGKDVGINVRKKVETILALLNDREKIQAVRDKAATNRDKYIGLSSTGISFRSSSDSYSSSNSFYKNDHYGSGSRDGDSFKNSSKEGEQYEKDSKRKHESKESENFQNVGDGKSQLATRKKDSSPSNSSKIVNNPAAVPSKTPIANPNVEEEDFGDFDPRGSSAGTVNVSTNQMDLFGPSLVGDLMDADGDPSFSPNVNADDGGAAGNTDVDLFADATFQSASPAQSTPDSHNKGNVDPFASQNSFPTFPGNVDLFPASDAGLPSKTMPAETLNAKSFDPFAEIPINNFSGSDPFDTFASHAAPISTQPSSSTNTSSKYIDEETFGDFTSHTEQTIPEHSSRSSLSNLKTPTTSAPASRKDNFQVKSGVWADCLSRGLIDLNISAPKKVNLADIGIVGGLEDASNEKEKGPSTTTAFMGRAMGSGSGLGWSGYSTAAGASGRSYTTYGQQEYGSFK